VTTAKLLEKAKKRFKLGGSRSAAVVVRPASRSEGWTSERAGEGEDGGGPGALDHVTALSAVMTPTISQTRTVTMPMISHIAASMHRGV
jgi:hypothetical protein